MDGHAILGHVAICASIVGDGGPRRYRRAGKPLPDKYLPGRFLGALDPQSRAEIVRAATSAVPPAPWFLRLVVDEEPSLAPPPPPVDRRWSRRGRWSTP